MSSRKFNKWIFCVIAIFSCVNNIQGKPNLPKPTTDADNLANVMRKSYQMFTVDLVRDFLNTRKMGEPAGAEGISPISVAYMLAVAHAQVWPVPTSGLDNLLHLEDHKIQPSYQNIVQQLTNDTHVFIHSNILTSTKGVQTPQNVSDLKTRVSYIDYRAPNTNDAVMHINSMLSAHTFGKNYERLIPLGGWYGTAIYNYTLGVFLNTLYFNGEWAHPFYSIGPMDFTAGNNKLLFLEAFGNFTVFHQPNYRALRIPFKNSSKVLMLVQPQNRKSIKKFVDEEFQDFLELRQNKSQAITMELRIRVPEFNFSLMNSFTENLRNMGLKSSLCDYKLSNVNTFEAFVQSSYTHLAEDKFEIAYATGATLSNVKSYRDFIQHGENDEPRVEKNQAKVETTTEGSAGVSASAGTSEKFSYASEPDPDGLFILDSPFLWYFEDEHLELGPLILGTLESAPLRTQPEQVPEGFEWLLETKRYMYWTCPDHLGTVQS